MTFEQAATGYHEHHKSSWRNLKHMCASLLDAAVIGKLPVADIEKRDVIRALEFVRKTKRETATACASRPCLPGQPRAAIARATIRRVGKAQVRHLTCEEGRGGVVIMPSTM